MVINNLTEMNNFLNSNGLANLGGRLSACINEYSALCACKPHEKSAKLMECENNYLTAINNMASNKPIVFNKIRERIIEFRKNGQLIMTLIK
jgi:hypothetical protein